jgi:hypothetical protein
MAYEYKINVASPNGKTFDGKPAFKFFFRTEPVDQLIEATQIATSLRNAFPGYSVTIISRSRISETIDF